METRLDALCSLSDDALLTKLDQLAGADRALTVDIIFHLAALDERRVYLDLGYSSLFVYATERDGMTGAIASPTGVVQARGFALPHRRGPRRGLKSLARHDG